MKAHTHRCKCGRFRADDAPCLCSPWWEHAMAAWRGMRVRVARRRRIDANVRALFMV